jgi:hypothetical protein
MRVYSGCGPRIGPPFDSGRYAPDAQGPYFAQGGDLGCLKKTKFF